MKKKFSLFAKCLLLISFPLIISALFSSAAISLKKNRVIFNIETLHLSKGTELYDILALDSLGLSKEAFSEAMAGYLKLQKAGTIQNTTVLSIVDFSQPSFKKRLYILDMENGKLLFNTLVAHGRNSGALMATRFSNRSSSFESSLGFYLTGDAYYGQNGYSLRLVGMERGINNNAFSRGIVVHAADYVNDDISRIYGRLGRSEGCPAIPVSVHRPVIERIKNGSCFFIYGKNRNYINQSRLIRDTRFS